MVDPANGGILKGQATLVNGATAAISAPGLQTSSTIVPALRTPNTGSLSVKFSALDSDRVYGASGSFKITALLANNLINVLDQSGMDWIVNL